MMKDGTGEVGEMSVLQSSEVHTLVNEEASIVAGDVIDVMGCPSSAMHKIYHRHNLIQCLSDDSSDSSNDDASRPLWAARSTPERESQAHQTVLN
jgi:hypothetical protein